MRLGMVPAPLFSSASLQLQGETKLRWTTPWSLPNIFQSWGYKGRTNAPDPRIDSFHKIQTSQPIFPSLISPVAICRPCRKEGALLCYSSVTKRAKEGQILSVQSCFPRWSRTGHISPHRSLLVLGCPLVFSCFLPPLGMSLLNINQILLWAQNEAATGLVLLNWDPIWLASPDFW